MIIFEPTRYGERNIELRAKLFEDRKIFLTGAINPIIIEEVIMQLLILDNQNNRPIWLYLSTNGGEVLSGMSLISAIERLSSPVNTVCLSNAMSMGAVILSSGTGYRYITKYGWVMIHSVKSGFYGHEKDIELAAENTKELNNMLMGILAKNCGYTLDEIKELTEHDLYLNAERAVKFGIVDQII